MRLCLSLIASLCLLAVVSAADPPAPVGPSVMVPVKVSGPANRWLRVRFALDGNDTVWIIAGGTENVDYDVIAEPDSQPNYTTLRFCSYTGGDYTLVVSSNKNNLQKLVKCSISVPKIAPPVPPGPNPMRRPLQRILSGNECKTLTRRMRPRTSRNIWPICGTCINLPKQQRSIRRL